MKDPLELTCPDDGRPLTSNTELAAFSPGETKTHVKMLVQGIMGKWSCRVGGRWEYIFVLTHNDNIGGVSTT